MILKTIILDMKYLPRADIKYFIIFNAMIFALVLNVTSVIYKINYVAKTLEFNRKSP